MKSCLENYWRDCGYHKVGLKSDLFKGINWNIMTTKVRDFLTTCFQRMLLSRVSIWRDFCWGTYSLTSSVTSLLPPPTRRGSKAAHSQAWCSRCGDSASAEVKHSHFSLSRAFSMCCQCAGKNDLKLLSAQLLVHASQSHSDKPVTTQRRLLEKSTRAGL